MQTYLFVALAVFFFVFTSSATEVTTDAEKKSSTESAEVPDADKNAEKKEDPAAADGKPAAATSTASSHTGEIFVIRNGPKTEVFFRNHNQSYFIPKGNKHNAQLKELQKKSKLSQPVTIEFNAKTREISQVQESRPAPAASATSSSKSDGSAADSKGTSK